MILFMIPKRILLSALFRGSPIGPRASFTPKITGGLSQECIPVKFAKNSNDVIRGSGQGVTIVTAPYEAGSESETGVGIRPELACYSRFKISTNRGYYARKNRRR